MAAGERNLTLGAALERRRQTIGMSRATLADELLLGAGWVETAEADLIEPSLELLRRWCDALETTMIDVIQDVSLVTLTSEEGIAAITKGGDLDLRFRHGQHIATYTLHDCTLKNWQSFVRTFRDSMRADSKADAVAESFLNGVRTWPAMNPSDLWYFIMPRLYMDMFNHSAEFAANKDLSQSWKRTSGWALEKVIADFYNPHLISRDITLLVGDRERKARLLNALNLGDRIDVAKADIVVVAEPGDRDERAIGVLHVKASLAERRNADEAMSQALLSRGLISSFVTMDAKGTPDSRPLNRGELGEPRGDGRDRRSVKRLEIEEQRMFDACFSYNSNTRPTPPHQASAARIHVLNFVATDDQLSRHLVSTWDRLRGL